MQRFLGNRQVDAVEKINDNAKRQQKCDWPSSLLRSGFPGAGGRCAHHLLDLRAWRFKLRMMVQSFPQLSEVRQCSIWRECCCVGVMGKPCLAKIWASCCCGAAASRR